MEFNRSEIETYFAERVPGLRQTNQREWRGKCPVHNGDGENFAVNTETGQCFCHSRCGQGWDLISLEMAITGKGFADAKEEVFRITGRPDIPWNERDIEATYDYTDAAGRLLYQVVRRTGKKFQQRRPDNRGGWAWGLAGCARVPYCLPELAGSEFAYIVEGEKDVHTLRRLGCVATCNNGGAGNFADELAPYFDGKHICILPDNDEPGRQHALGVATRLSQVAASIRIVELPGLPAKGDVSDFVAAGGDLEEIGRRYEQAVDWTPEWEFSTSVPHEGDQFIRTLRQHIEAVGGLDRFWDLTLQKGVPTPFEKLTKALAGGLQKGEMYVIGSNQGAGKTSLALQFAIAAIRARHGVLMMSMEMDWTQVFQRMVAIEARIDLKDYRERLNEGFYTRDIRDALDAASKELMDYSLNVHVKTGVTTEFLTDEVRRLKKRENIDLVIVDHLQLMAATGTVRGDYEKFTSISRHMKEVAKDLAIPILLVSQTSRANSFKDRIELDVSDLRGSGAIEEDAAAVMLLYPDKDSYQQHKDAQTLHIGPIKTWIKLGKNRYGPSGQALPLWHYKPITRFDYVGDYSEAGR